MFAALVGARSAEAEPGYSVFIDGKPVLGVDGIRRFLDRGVFGAKVSGAGRLPSGLETACLRQRRLNVVICVGSSRLRRQMLCESTGDEYSPEIGYRYQFRLV